MIANVHQQRIQTANNDCHRRLLEQVERVSLYIMQTIAMKCMHFCSMINEQKYDEENC